MFWASINYWLSVALGAVLVAYHVTALLDGPESNLVEWSAGLLVTTVFAFILFSMLWGKQRCLVIAKRCCYLSVACSLAAIPVGVSGFFVYSADLAVWLLIGVTYLIISGIFLAGVNEAEKRLRADWNRGRGSISAASNVGTAPQDGSTEADRE